MDIQHLTAPLNVISLGRAGGDELSTERAGHPPDAGHHLLLHPRQPPRCPQRSPCQSASQALEHLVAGTRGHRPPRLPDCHAWRRLPAGESALSPPSSSTFPSPVDPTHLPLLLRVGVHRRVPLHLLHPQPVSHLPGQILVSKHPV